MAAAYMNGHGAQPDRPDKRLATAKARAALMGATLYQAEDDRGQPVYIVTRWQLTRELPSLEAVEQWLDRVDGKAGA